MRVVVAQNEFISDLFIKNDGTCQVTSDLFDFISSDYRNYDLICDFKNAEEYETAIKSNPLWELMLDKIDNISFDDKILKSLGQDDFYDRIGLHGLFLLDVKAEYCEELIKKRGYIYLCLENITSNWPIYKTCKNEQKLKVTKNAQMPDLQRLDCWSKISKLSHSFNSIIIFDRYALKDSSQQKISDNLLPLLKNLLKNNVFEGKITVSVLTEISVDELQKKYDILDKLLKKEGMNNIGLNVIIHDKGIYPKNFEGLHSRMIITNYLRITATDSFNFFKPNKLINNEADVDISFCLRSDRSYFYTNDLNALKTYIRKVRQSLQISKHILYYPDTVNYLLN